MSEPQAWGRDSEEMKRAGRVAQDTKMLFVPTFFHNARKKSFV